MIRKLSMLRTTTQKRRAQLFLLGGLIFLILSLLLFTVERFARETVYFYAASTLLSSVVSAFFALAVLRGQMFKSPREMRSSIAYPLASSIILAIYFLSVQAVTESLLHYLHISSYAANAIFVLVLVILIRPLEVRIHHTLDTLLSRDLNRYRHNMVGFSRDISNYIPTDEFFRRVAAFLSRQFNIQNVVIFLKHETSPPDFPRRQFYEWPDSPGSTQMEDDCFLVQHLRRVKRGVEFYDIDRTNMDPTVRSFFESKGVRLLFPLLSADEVIGILAISVRQSGQELTTDMVEALTIMANEVATAYERNLTIERIRRKEQAEFRVQHLASLGQLTAGVAHEIRNPLNVMSASAQTLLKKHLNAEEERELKQFIVDESDRLNKILTDFLSLSKLRAPKYEAVSLEELLQKVCTAIMPTAGKIQVRVAHGNADTEVTTDRDMLYQLLFNLGINAIDAINERCKSDPGFSSSKGSVIFSTSSEGRQLHISISDNGAGIPEESLEKIFEPFYTTKQTGTGLGLSISHNIAETLGGHIDINSKRGRTVFTFTFAIKKEKS